MRGLYTESVHLIIYDERHDCRLFVRAANTRLQETSEFLLRAACRRSRLSGARPRALNVRDKGSMSNVLVYVAYPVTSVVVLAFGLFAMVAGYIHFRRDGKDTTEFFLTARNSAGLYRVAFSMYAGGLGSWALFSAPSYAYTAGDRKIQCGSMTSTILP